MHILTLPPDLQATTLTPKRKPARFPLALTIPPERATLPGLALINGQWRRLDDGSIRAVFNSREELETCVQATRAIRAAMTEATG